MICKVCGKEYSERTMPLHQKRCRGTKIEVEKTVQQLKNDCKKLGIVGYSNLKKSELLEVLNGSRHINT